MKTLIRIIVLIAMLILFPKLLKAQIDYRQHPTEITRKDSVVRIDWLLNSPEKCDINFNHYVNFININNDKKYGSTVVVELYHNNRYVRNYIFETGDNMYNRIYLHQPLKIRKGDNIHFIFKLRAFENNEKYVFNIFQDSKINKNKQQVVATSIVKKRPVKEIKHKSKSVSYRPKRNQQIGSEINGREAAL